MVMGSTVQQAQNIAEDVGSCLVFGDLNIL